MTTQKYPRYKPSNITWLGDVPENWEVKKLKYVAEINPTKSNFPQQKNSDFEVVFLPMERVSESGKYQQDIRKRTNELSSGFTYFEKGDLIVAKITPCFENGKGALLDQLETNFGFGSTEFHVLRARKQVSKEFLSYIIRAENFMSYGEASMTGSAGQKRVPSGFIEHFSIALPPLPEQTSIAHYLDTKTAQIDRLIAAKQQLLALLREERAALINRAVTQGLDPNEKMKDSGVAWLGEVPEGWEVKKLKYVATKVGSGITPTGGASVYLEEGIPLLRSQNVYDDGLRLDDVAFISEEIDEQMSISRIQEGDVLLNITGASIGRCFYVPENFGRGNVNQHVCIIRPDHHLIQTQFLHAVLISDYGQTLINTCQNGANREGLNFQQIKNFDLPLPTLSEQIEIIKSLDNLNIHIDSTAQKITAEIALLQEYRTALISEAVTGKIKITES